MVGLIQEGQDLMDEEFECGVKDAALISGAQRVEHYEIAAYRCVRTWAGLLGETEAEASRTNSRRRKGNRPKAHRAF
jgi:ferritin-like metal-binding protein YciE